MAKKRKGGETTGPAFSKKNRRKVDEEEDSDSSSSSSSSSDSDDDGRPRGEGDSDSSSSSSSSSSDSSDDDDGAHGKGRIPPPPPMVGYDDGTKKFRVGFKPKRDPQAPALPQQAYFIFARERRTNLKRNQPNLSYAEINKRTGLEWKELGKSARVKYEASAAIDKQRYLDQLKVYKPAEDSGYGLDGRLIENKADSTDKGHGSRKSLLPRRDPRAPKPPARAYILFMNGRRKELKADAPITFAEAQFQIGKEWSSLDPKSKTQYEKMAEKDKERYLNEMKVYEPEEGSGYDADGHLIVDRKGKDADDEGDGPFLTRGRRSKKGPKRDPEAPRAPTTAFIMFASSRRDLIKDEHPGLPFVDVQKLLGKEWHELTERDKKKWTDKADKDKQRYLNEMVGYIPPVGSNFGADGYLITASHASKSSGENGAKPASSKKTLRDPFAPKQPQSAFTMFTQSRRENYKAANPDMSFTDLQRKLGADWKNLTGEERDEFDNLAATDKRRFLREIESYEPQPGSGFNAMGVMVVDKKDLRESKKKKKRRDPEAPKLPLHAYGFYVKERRAALKEDARPSHEIITQIASEWRSMDEKTRKKYLKKSEEDVTRYKKAMKTYVPSDGYAPDGTVVRSDDIIGPDGKKRRKKKKAPKRDPEAPKPATPAFALFAQTRRSELKEQQPELSFPEMQKKLGMDWQNLSDKSKAKFLKNADKEKSRFEREIKEYTPAEGYDAKGRMEVVDDGLPNVKLPKRDPLAPKPAERAYILYNVARRKELKEQQPNMVFAEAQKIIGEEWQKLSSKAKEKFEKRAAEDKKRFEREMLTYQPAEGSGYGSDGVLEADKANRKRKRPKRDPKAPKQPLRSFVLYMSKRREQIKEDGMDIAFGDASKLIGGEWKNLEDKERAKWEKKAAHEKTRYAREMATYTPSFGYGDDGNLINDSSDRDGEDGSYDDGDKKKDGAKIKQKATRDPGAPKPPNAAFLYFMTRRREQLKAQGPISATKLSAEWKTMDDAAKDPFIKLAQRDSDRYKAELAVYRPPPGYNAKGQPLKDGDALKVGIMSSSFGTSLVPGLPPPPPPMPDYGLDFLADSTSKKRKNDYADNKLAKKAKKSKKSKKKKHKKEKKHKKHVMAL